MHTRVKSKILNINHNTGSSNIVARWSKYCFDFIKVIFWLAHSSSHFQRLLFINLHGASLKADIICLHVIMVTNNCKSDKKAMKIAINCTKQIGGKQSK